MHTPHKVSYCLEATWGKGQFTFRNLFLGFCLFVVCVVCLFFCVGKPEADIGHLPQLLFTLFFETGSLAKPRAHLIQLTSEPWGVPVSTSPALGVHGDITMDAEDQISGPHKHFSLQPQEPLLLALMKVLGFCGSGS